MRRGQTEIFGLVVVVLLVSLLLLLVLSYVISNQGTDARQTYTDDQLGINFMKSLLSTTIPHCRSVTFDDVLIDCFSSQTLQCTDMGGQPVANSCTFIEEFVPYVLENSLDAWGKDYELTFSDRAGHHSSMDFISTPNNCNSAENVYASDLVLPAITTTVIMSIRICD